MLRNRLDGSVVLSILVVASMVAVGVGPGGVAADGATVDGVPAAGTGDRVGTDRAAAAERPAREASALVHAAGDATVVASTAESDPADPDAAAAGTADTRVRGDVSWQNGTAVPGARVQLVDTDTGSVVVDDLVTQDVDDPAPGEWGSVPVEPGNYTVELDDTGTETSDLIGRVGVFSERVTVERGEARKIETVLDPPVAPDPVACTPVREFVGEVGTLTVTVRSQDDGSLLEGATVDVVGKRGNPAVEVIDNVTKVTDADGEVTFNVTSDEVASATFTFDVTNDGVTEQFECVPENFESNVTVASLAVSPGDAGTGETLAVGDGLSAEVVLRNDGPATARDVDVELLIDADDDGSVADETVLDAATVDALAGDGTTTVTLSGALPADLDEGEYPVRVTANGSHATATITVTGDNVEFQDYDANGDGNINTSELSEAIDDWAIGEITTAWLSEVIEEWARTSGQLRTGVRG